MKKKIKLAYDISVLGARDRSGVFRTIEEVLDGLLDSNYVDLKLCTSQDNFKDCYHFLIKKSFRLDDDKLVEYFYRPLKRLLVTINPNLEIQSIDNLHGVHAYLSPWNAIPDKINQDLKIRKFVVVYDMIPLVMPDLCHDAMPTYFKSFVNDINNDCNILCISQNTKDDFLKYKKNFNEKQISILYLGADMKKFYKETNNEKKASIRKKYNIPSKKYFLSVATLEPRKNFAHVIKSFVGFLEKYKVTDINLVITGASGWKFENIFSTVEGFEKYKKNIVFTGFVENKDMASLYSAASGFIYMSLYEGFGLPILEAMQCGVPVIASDNSSIPEIIGDSGITISATNKDDLIKNMYYVYNDSSARAQMSKKGLEQAAKFSWNKTLTKLEDTIRKTVAAPLPKISIITVCFNEEKDIKKTCESVVGQDFDQYEWLVVDGGSTDSTLDILEEYKPRMAHFISEKDNGIYDAMNKGIRMAKGEYLLFLNSGDYLVDANVLKKVFEIKKQTSDILYGDCISVQRNGDRLDWVQPGTIDMNFLCSFQGINHQSAFISRSLFLKYGNYDTMFRSAADSEKWCCFLENGSVYEKLPFKIAIVKGYDGMSSSEKNRNIIQYEQERIRTRYLHEEKKEYEDVKSSAKSIGIAKKWFAKMVFLVFHPDKFIKKYATRIIHGRFRQLIRRIYYAIRLKKIK